MGQKREGVVLWVLVFRGNGQRLLAKEETKRQLEKEEIKSAMSTVRRVPYHFMVGNLLIIHVVPSCCPSGHHSGIGPCLGNTTRADRDSGTGSPSALPRDN